ncbi:DMT family transporter [Oleiagrimonas sp. C23AA]|uniref:DMT family transporter n=1 Tax=Oleiagrimonas sp. C23AA TaxID=2719047 RepID=UPI0031B6C090
MPLSTQGKAQFQIHFCVLLWGVTAILGKAITLHALDLVWWRMLIVTVALLGFPRVWRGLGAMSWRTIGAYAGIGVLVSLHWLSFYGAIKLANASVGAICIAIAPVFLAFVEPLFTGSRFNRRELLIGVGVVPGVALIVGGVPDDMHLGLLVGVVSALFVALFGALNKRMVGRGDALTVTCIELGAGTAFLTLLAPFMPHAGALFPLPDLHDTVLLLILSLLCTLLPFALALDALRHLSAFVVQMTTNLEPVYAIVLAMPLLGEQRQLDMQFYLGVVIVLAAVFAHPYLVRVKKPAPEMLATAEAKNLSE